jgi:hypothetical protein
MFVCAIQQLVQCSPLASEQLVLGDVDFDTIASEVIRRQCVNIRITLNCLLTLQG